MGYTTVQNVAGMFPFFVRGAVQQKPSDALIQHYIDDVAGEIDAVLGRRFNELIQGYGPAAPANFLAFLTALPATSVLWQASTAYALGALALDSNGGVQQVTTAGTSGSSAPNWAATPGGATTDSTVVWQNVSGDASRILEKINRYGAAVQLGQTLATFGLTSARSTRSASPPTTKGCSTTSMRATRRARRSRAAATTICSIPRRARRRRARGSSPSRAATSPTISRPWIRARARCLGSSTPEERENYEL